MFLYNIFSRFKAGRFTNKHDVKEGGGGYIGQHQSQFNRKQNPSCGFFQFWHYMKKGWKHNHKQCFHFFSWFSIFKSPLIFLNYILNTFPYKTYRLFICDILSSIFIFLRKTNLEQYIAYAQRPHFHYQT